MPTTNIYESPRLLDEYLLFHFAEENDIFPANGIPYPKAMREATGFTERTVGHFKQSPVERGLDLGCAVGASTFAMARHCAEVIGIDYSHAFIHAAAQLQQGREIRYRRHDEGHHFTELTAAVPDAEAGSRCTFEQGDALNLRGDLGTFDRVHAANLLCRLNRPVELLKKLPSLVRPGGELVLATPCTWLGEFTPPGQWPVGSTAEWLTENLQNHFSLVKSTHEPFLIRETARKFQWSSSLVTVWEKSS